MTPRNDFLGKINLDKYLWDIKPLYDLTYSI